MGSVISWFYEAVAGVDQWVSETWTALVIQEQRHPFILAIATAIVLSLVLTLLCNLCSCCWDMCCHRPNYPRYQPIYDTKHNYSAIPSTTQPPYNPTAPSTSATKSFMAPVSVHQV